MQLFVYNRALFLILLVVVIGTIAISSPVFADQATSTNFKATNAAINTFGGNATSSNFSSVQSGDQTGGGESTSTSFLLASGNLYFDSFTPKQQNWRWYDDEENETPTNPFAGENVAPSNVANNNLVKLRVSVAEVAGYGKDQVKFKLQFATSSDFSGSVHTVAEEIDCTGGSEWCYADGGGNDGAIITTKVLSDADTCASSVGDGCGTHNESGTTTSTFTQLQGTVTEYEFTLEQSGAEANTVYFFRLFDTTSDSAVPYNTGYNYPSISSEGTSLTFTINGVASLTSTSGVVTTIETTSTDVPFGTLLISTPQVGAHRLTVTTNATQGYQVFTYTQQDLLGSTDGKIPPVPATNQSPLGWSSACTLELTGCYGYHTSDAVLSGGSTRFAADDTYAQFSTTTLSEVAFSSAATTSRTTDIVYKIEVHDEQVPDTYSTNVVYVVVPTF